VVRCATPALSFALLLSGNQLLRFLFRARVFSHLRARFRVLKALFHRGKTRFDTCHIRWAKTEVLPASMPIITASLRFLYILSHP
jgi:hypothetical protein